MENVLPHFHTSRMLKEGKKIIDKGEYSKNNSYSSSKSWIFIFLWWNNEAKKDEGGLKCFLCNKKVYYQKNYIIFPLPLLTAIQQYFQKDLFKIVKPALELFESKRMKRNFWELSYLDHIPANHKDFFQQLENMY